MGHDPNRRLKLVPLVWTNQTNSGLGSELWWVTTPIDVSNSLTSFEPVSLDFAIKFRSLGSELWWVTTPIDVLNSFHWFCPVPLDWTNQTSSGLGSELWWVTTPNGRRALIRLLSRFSGLGNQTSCDPWALNSSGSRPPWICGASSFGFRNQTSWGPIGARSGPWTLICGGSRPQSTSSTDSICC